MLAALPPSRKKKHFSPLIECLLGALEIPVSEQGEEAQTQNETRPDLHFQSSLLFARCSNNLGTS